VAPVASRYELPVARLEALFAVLRARGYRIVGPRVRDGAIVYTDLASGKDLPAGITDEQSPGRYRLAARSDGALFGYAVGPHSWKQFFHVADERLFTLRRSKDGPRLEPEPLPAGRLALIGVRACELAAIAVQDRVLRDGAHTDARYAARRSDVFVVAVQCTSGGGNCFCSSLGTGPQVRGGHDLALTELPDAGEHRFVLEPGSPAGRELVDELGLGAARDDDVGRANAAVELAGREQRQFEASGVRELLLSQLEHPAWDDVAGRCLACGNCTLVCPTCYCSSVVEVAPVPGEIERRRQLDSCFTQEASYLHGGSVRVSIRSRYRQWLTHKLATWFDQFGSSGCVGCGRCVTWCPVGIDLVAEVARFRGGAATAPAVDRGEAQEA
jgi:sulfhydrogenase subunit beta (sulfur reductase)